MILRKIIMTPKIKIISAKNRITLTPCASYITVYCVSIFCFTSDKISTFILSNLGGYSLHMRKILCALMIVLCVSGIAFADDDTVSVSSVDIRRDPSGNTIDMKSPEGLRIIYIGTFRAEAKELSPDAEDDEGIFSVFMVKSDKDTPLQLDIRDGYDTRTNKFSWRNDAPWGYIADIDTNGNPRDILETFWVRATFWHNLPFKYGKYPVIARIGFVINGNELTYKRIRPKSWEEWKKVEPKIVELEENDTERDFTLDELEALSQDKK